MNRISDIEAYIEQCAFDEDDIGNASIGVSLRFDVSINLVLKIMDKMLKQAKVKLYEYEGDQIKVLNYDGDILKLYKANRYCIFLCL